MTQADFLSLCESHQAVLLEPRAELDQWVVGAASVDGHVVAVYDTTGLVEWFRDEGGQADDDVLEWIEFNVRPACRSGWPILTHP